MLSSGAGHRRRTSSGRRIGRRRGAAGSEASAKRQPDDRALAGYLLRILLSAAPLSLPLQLLSPARRMD